MYSLHFAVDGLFNESTALKIKEKMEGKTYFNFHIEIWGTPVNYGMTVYSDNSNYTIEDAEDAKSMFYWYALNLLGGEE